MRQWSLVYCLVRFSIAAWLVGTWFASFLLHRLLFFSPSIWKRRPCLTYNVYEEHITSLPVYWAMIKQDRKLLVLFWFKAACNPSLFINHGIVTVFYSCNFDLRGSWTSQVWCDSASKSIVYTCLERTTVYPSIYSLQVLYLSLLAVEQFQRRACSLLVPAGVSLICLLEW